MFQCRVENCEYADIGVKESVAGVVFISVARKVREELDSASAEFAALLRTVQPLVDILDYPSIRCSTHEPEYLFEASGSVFPFGCADPGCTSEFLQRIRGGVWDDIGRRIILIEQRYRQAVDKLVEPLWAHYSFLNMPPYFIHYSYMELNPPADPWRFETRYIANGTVQGMLSAMLEPQCFNFDLRELWNLYNCPLHQRENREAGDGDDE